jgi:DNA-binding GntR family transcriptional regulator
METEKLTGKIKDFDFRPHVLGEQVSHILMEAILEGVLRGGDQLVEVELQKQFGVSRSPLREAFRDLEKKGLVVIIPRKGTYVKQVNRKDIEDNFPVRAVLEGLAAREAYPNMTAQIIEALSRALQKMEAAVEISDTKAYWRNHLEFHDIFITASHNEVLINILKTLRMHSLWHRFSYQYYLKDLKRSLAVHQTIFNLFRDRDTNINDLASLVQEHIQTALLTFLAYLDEQDAGS